MNSNEYISSGILESYVLGVATPEEMQEVEKYASMYPEIKLELEKIEEAINTYASEHSVQPPSHLKEKILAAITAEATVSKPANEPIVRTINQPLSAPSKFSFWAIAASFLFLISAGFAMYFGMQNSKLNNSLNEMAKANAALSDSIKSIASNMSQMHNDMAILAKPTNKMVELKGLKVSPESKAMVCWSPADKKVYVEVEKLPEAPSGMQYQLWAIVDGKPVSEGMLTSGNGFHAMRDVDDAQAFAITLEKEGGSPTPKGDMYVMGTI